MRVMKLIDGMRRIVRRLSEAEEQDAIQAFVEYRGKDADDAFAAGCVVIYEDHYQTGQSWYQVVDGRGHGDGSGTWTEVKEEQDR